MMWSEASDLYDSLGETVVRVAVLPGSVGDLVERFAPRAWLAHAANGVVFMAVEPEEIQPLRAEFPVILERAPLEVRRRIPTFGMRGTEYDIMCDLKHALDPDARLNPGRHVDGESAA